MKKSSVSEILTWRRCRRLHNFRYKRRLDLLERSVNLASGTAVHETIQAVLEGTCTKENAGSLAESILAYELLMTDKVDKYLPGVLNALSKVPQWVWDYEGWKVEEFLEVIIRAETTTVEGLILRMKPDLYRVLADRVEDIYWLEILDFKTGKTDPLDYLLYNPQLAYYAVGLVDYLKPLDVIPMINYIGLPTQGKEKTEGAPWVLSTTQLDYARRELVQGIEEVGVGEAWPSRDTLCNYCDYKDVCKEMMMGGDPEAVIKEKFFVKDMVV